MSSSLSASDKVCAVIVAAGSSTRLGRDKMFLTLEGQPLLSRTLAVFEHCAAVDEITLVMAARNLERGRSLATAYPKVRQVVPGGERRQDSVLAGLRSLADCAIVLIHDGARPLLTERIIEEGLRAVRHTGAAVAGVPVKDTIKTVDAAGYVQGTLERSTLRAIQTPQVFRYGLLLAAYDQVGERDFTDDAALVEAVGHKVLVYPASYENIKVTTAEDVAQAEAILRGRAGAS